MRFSFLMAGGALALFATQEGTSQTTPNPLPSRKVFQADGHKVTFIRLTNPVLVPVIRPVIAKNAEEIATELRRGKKQFVEFVISANIFEDGLSEIQWSYNDSTYHALSTVNFLHFTGLSEIETDDTVFSFLLSMGRAEKTDKILSRLKVMRQVPGIGKCDFVVDQVNAGIIEENALLGIDVLHAYYQIHGDAMARAFIAREAEYAKKEAERPKSPTPIPDSEIQYWRVNNPSTDR